MNLDSSELIVKLEGLFENLRGFVWKKENSTRTKNYKYPLRKSRKLEKSWIIE